MEIVKTEGIVIGETNYSESSKILKVLTKNYGIISIMSKGCRNLKSKLRGVSSKLVYATFQFYYKDCQQHHYKLVKVFQPFVLVYQEVKL